MNLTAIAISIFTLFVASGAGAQPYWEAYTPPQAAEIWCSVRTSEGDIWIGSDALWHYDGLRWTRIAAGDSHVIRELAYTAPGERLYVGGFSELGYVSLDERPHRYVSWDDQIEPQDQGFGDVWQVQVSGETVFFVTNSRVFAFRDDSLVETLREESPRLFLAPLGDELAVLNPRSDQLRVWEGNRWGAPRDGGDYRPFARFLDGGAASDGLLLSFYDGLFRLRGDGGLAPWGASMLSAHILSDMMPWSGGRFLVSSYGSGLFLLNREGSIARHLTGEHVLPSAQVLQLDPQGADLVRVTDLGGVAVTDLARYVHRVSHPVDASSQINHVRVEGGYVCILTENGLWYRPQASLTDPEFAWRRFGTVPVRTVVWQETAQRLLVGGIGLFALNPVTGDYRRLSGELALASAVGPDGTTALGLDDGVAILRADGAMKRVGGLTHQVHDLVFTGSGTLWAAATNLGLFRIDPATAIATRVEGLPFAPTRALVSHVGGKLRVRHGLEQWVYGDGTWQRHGVELPTAGSASVQIEEEAIITVHQPESDGAPLLTRFDVGTGQKREWSLATMVSGSANRLSLVLADDKLVGLVGSSLFTISLDFFTRPPAEVRPRLTALTLDREALPFSALSDLPHNPGALQLVFSYPQFDLLSDRRLTASLWSGDNRLFADRELDRGILELVSLSSGSYRVEVTPALESGLPDATFGFGFRVLPPWYQTPWFYAGLFGLALVLAYVGQRVRTYALARSAERLNEVVALRTQSLREANEQQREFLARMSHGVRNPLNGVVGLIQRLKQAPDLSPAACTTLRDLEHATSLVRRTVQHMLELNRIERGMVRVDPVEFALADLPNEIEALFASLAASKNLDLVVERRFDERVRVFADQQKLTELCGNLVDNAIKYTPEGRVTVVVVLRPLAQPDQGRLQIVVSDTGVGIPSEQQQAIFQPYERVSEQKEGLGLGLAIARTFAEAMNARLGLRSEPGAGSTFSLELDIPLSTGEGDRVPADLVPQLVVHLVEDSYYNRIAVETYLNATPWTLVVSANADEAIVNSRLQHFDILLLDWELGEKNGIELYRQLRRDKLLGCPVILISAYATDEHREAAREAGIRSFLPKPFTGEALISSICELTAQKQRPPARSLHRDPAVEARLHEEWSVLSAQIEGDVARRDPQSLRRHVHDALGLAMLVTAPGFAEALRELQRAAHRADYGRCYQSLRRASSSLEEASRLAANDS